MKRLKTVAIGAPALALAACSGGDAPDGRDASPIASGTSRELVQSPNGSPLPPPPQTSDAPTVMSPSSARAAAPSKALTPRPTASARPAETPQPVKEPAIAECAPEHRAAGHC